MALEALHPLGRTIHHLLSSPLLSIESPGREILETAHYAVTWTIEFLVFTDREHIKRKRIEGLEADVEEAARALEDVLDSHVSDLFLSGDEGQPLLFNSLDLQGVTQYVVGFLQKVKNLHKEFNPWFEEEEEEDEEDKKESDIFELSDGYRITKSMFMSWFTNKAASIFLGMKEDYFEDLSYMLPDEQEDDDYTVLFTSNIFGMKLEDRYSEMKYKLTVWWINKAASFFVPEEECIQEIVSPLPEEKEEDDEKQEEDFGSSNKFGSTDLSRAERDYILKYSDEFKAVSFIGMAGIGKTDLVMRIIQDPLFSSKFECTIFVRMGPKCEFKHMLQAILAQLNPDGDHMLIEEDENIKKYLGDMLLYKKYVIVLDDVWDSSLVCDLVEIIPRNPGSIVLLTTRVDEIAYVLNTIYHVPFLNKEESWDLLRGKIFAEKECPRELEKAGKKIAENCEGLPLLIVTVADLLSKAEKTVEYWTKIAADKTNSIFVGAYERILKVLYPSYYHLSQDLQTCFLYMGAFPQNCEIRISKLINLWSAEGFLGDSFSSLHNFLMEKFKKLVFDNVALDPQQRIMYRNVKVFSLHSVFWYLCKRVAWDEKFLHVLNSYKDASKQDKESRRRLSIYKNVILSRKDVHESIASMSAVRAFLCTGPYHKYQVPLCLGLRLLKILDALTIRFYEFPLGVLELFHLRHLALSCNENLPPSISKLWKLQCLIVHQHLSIRTSVRQLSYVPVEIWGLQELEYLQIMGRDLPDPPPGAFLTNLLILLDVGARTICKSVVESIPNLEKLRVQIELVPDAVVPLSRCFYEDISRLEVLKSLQCVVANPILVSRSTKFTLFYTRRLRKLTLSGFGFRSKDMDRIAELPCLQVLKLKCYAFRWEEWHVRAGEFRMLEYLSIEDTDLVQWTVSYNALPLLRGASFEHCYNLREIPYIESLRDIWLVDCHPSAAACAKQMELCDVHVDNAYMAR